MSKYANRKKLGKKKKKKTIRYDLLRKKIKDEIYISLNNKLKLNTFSMSHF